MFGIGLLVFAIPVLLLGLVMPLVRWLGRDRSLGALALAVGCEGARTPALVTTASIVPLTKREREIGLLAADGATSRDIGGRLYLSVRIVENHLQRTYAKLGVGNRAELADALRAGEPGAPPSLRR
jgi:DNA-binding CsgD family transcriptional regulator